jgi:hypothetical protein
MWLELSEEEYNIIKSALEQCNLFGLNYLLKKQLNGKSTKNVKHIPENAIKAANTYFSSSDTIIDNHVRWDENGDALVMTWQRVPSVYIQEHDCGCNGSV